MSAAPPTTSGSVSTRGRLTYILAVISASKLTAQCRCHYFCLFNFFQKLLAVAEAEATTA